MYLTKCGARTADSCETTPPTGIVHLRPPEATCKPSLYVGKNIMFNRVHYIVVKTSSGQVAKRMYPSVSAYGCCAMPVMIIISRSCFAKIPFALPLVSNAEEVCSQEIPEIVRKYADNTDDKLDNDVNTTAELTAAVLRAVNSSTNLSSAPSVNTSTNATNTSNPK